MLENISRSISARNLEYSEESAEHFFGMGYNDGQLDAQLKREQDWRLRSDEVPEIFLNDYRNGYEQGWRFDSEPDF